jgi:FdhD protein
MTERAAIVSITRHAGQDARTDQDLVVVEAPLAIELRRAHEPAASRSLGIVMRTPGDDEELALGLLHAEGLIRARADVLEIRRFQRPADEGLPASDEADVIQLDVSDEVDLESVSQRALLTTSACGLCGRLAIEAVGSGGALALDQPSLTADLIAGLPDALRSRQRVFAETGGLHAAGLFDSSGGSLAIREDVGRHNAVDKVVGWALTAGRLPARQAVLAVSGRVAFEIVQKAVRAGIPAVVAVGAPSSLAVDAARAARLTLVGFVRDGRFNVYAGAERLR